MEFVTTKRGARAIVYESHKSVLNHGTIWMYLLEGVGEVTAAVSLSALFKMRLCHRKTLITILQMMQKYKQKRSSTQSESKLKLKCILVRHKTF